MNENFEEDVIGRLIREEGLLTTSPGFTDRVMQLVENSARKKEIAFQPLVSGKMWMIIALAIVFLLLVSILLSARGNPGQPAYISKFLSLTDTLSLSSFPLSIDSGMAMLVTFILAIVSLLLFLDLLLNKRLQGLH